MRIAVRGEDFENAVMELEDGNVERAAAQIVDSDGTVFAFVESVGQRCGGGFVDQAQYLKTRDASGVFGGLSLGVVEVCGNRDDAFCDGLAEIGFSGFVPLAR